MRYFREHLRLSMALIACEYTSILFRSALAGLICILSTAAAAAGMFGSDQQVIDFTQPEQAAKLATWSDPKHLGCTKAGFGWDGEKRQVRDASIETEPLPIGTRWNPTRNAGIRITVQTNYPQVIHPAPKATTYSSPSIYVRFSADRVHWSDWQPTELSEHPRIPGTTLYTARVGVTRRGSESYDSKRRAWFQRDDIKSANDEDEFCRWLVKQEPNYFAKERPFVGYVQFLLEASFAGSQRLTRFDADVQWNVVAGHQPSKDAAPNKAKDTGWNFRGVELEPGKKD